MNWYDEKAHNPKWINALAEVRHQQHVKGARWPETLVAVSRLNRLAVTARMRGRRRCRNAAP
ncbi:MAG TPA: hypothetical protein VEM60_05715 [Candidatus Dormibacteraeota bacterium]|nr:hypothetical protein [Candidatus Dormibacteraeota bacterium]